VTNEGLRYCMSGSLLASLLCLALGIHRSLELGAGDKLAHCRGRDLQCSTGGGIVRLSHKRARVDRPKIDTAV
jgi:hypothetical protein